jgi:hypothetical protein
MDIASEALCDKRDMGDGEGPQLLERAKRLD